MISSPIKFQSLPKLHDGGVKHQTFYGSLCLSQTLFLINLYSYVSQMTVGFESFQGNMFFVAGVTLPSSPNYLSVG